MTDVQSPSHRHMLAAAMVATVVVTLDVSIVTIAFPEFQRSFGIPPSAGQWVLNAYTLVFASLQLNAGALVDRWGTRRTFLCGFSLFVSASLGCGLAPSWPVLLSARAFQGVGAALLIPSALAMLQRGIPDPAARARAIGWWAASGSAALAAGPVVGGALVMVAGWRSIFLINIPIGLVGVWLAWRLPSLQRKGAGGPLDLLGQTLAMATLGCLVLAVSESGRRGLTSGVVIGLATTALILASVLAWVERSVDAPMLPPGLLARGPVVSAIAVGAVVNLVFYGLILVLSVYLQTAQRRDALDAGLAIAPMMVALVGVNALSGWLHGRLGNRRTILTGLAIVVAGCGALAMAAGVATLMPLLPGLLLIGAGTAMTVPAIAASALTGVPLEEGGIVAGIFNAARQVGGALGVAAFGTLLNVSTVGDAMRFACVISAALSLLAMIIVLVARRRALPDLTPVFSIQPWGESVGDLVCTPYRGPTPQPSPDAENQVYSDAPTNQRASIIRSPDRPA